MEQSHKKIKLILICFLFIKCIALHGQSNMQFLYECGKHFEDPIHSKILLKRPEKTTDKLFSDTISKYNFSKNNFFKTKGQYTLSICFESEKYGKDSIEYDFEVKGNEINIIISVNFNYSEKFYKQENGFIQGEKVPNGYIRVNKYYEAPKSIDIKLDKEHESNEYYKDPFFKIKNNSNDTIYGEYLPGYFWGTLSYIRNDTIIASRIGIIDYEFADSPPFYPDSTKTATVGSFGLYKSLPPFNYQFEVMLAKKWQSQGIGVFLEKKNFVWWTGTKEFYRLKYNFKIEEMPKH